MELGRQGSGGSAGGTSAPSIHASIHSIHPCIPPCTHLCWVWKIACQLSFSAHMECHPNVRSLLPAPLSAGMQYLTACKLLKKKKKKKVQAGLDDLLPRSTCEMVEKPEREKPAESALADQAPIDFPIPANISVAGLKVLLISMCSFSALLTSVCLGLLQRLPVLSTHRAQSRPCLCAPAQHLSTKVIPSPFSRTLSHMLTFNYVLKPKTCELVLWSHAGQHRT